MSAVTAQEIVSLIDGIVVSDACMGSISDKQVIMAIELVNRIKSHGIAPPDGMVFVPEEPSFAMREAGNGALDKLKSDSTMQSADKAFYVYHAMLDAAEGQFIKQADEETHRRVDEAVRDGRIADKRVPGGMVLVPMEPTQEMIDAGIMFGTSPTKVSIIWGSMLAAAPEVKP